MEGSSKKQCIRQNDGIAGGASCTRTSTEVHEMATSSGYDYEVFLSFRGLDTRSGFTDFLYTSLDNAGIRTFKDNEELRVGEEFGPKLLEAIEQSKISIPIFSKGYASSIWCLKEVAQMVKCKESGRQKIMPIFYDVAPSEVRYQTRGFGEAFLTHENKNRYGEKIEEWKAALGAVGKIKGWDLQSMPNRQEGQLAKDVTQKVFNELKKAYLKVSDNLVNVDHQVDEIVELINAPASDTRIIGIHGMGGIGKTTIAKIIYNQLSDHFENCCFLPKIGETSEGNDIQFLQKQLNSKILKTECIDVRSIDEGIQIIKERLSNKRVLLLLDDVEDEKHMDALVGKREWLGKGSKLIITTRKKHILNVSEVNFCYELNGMNHNQSLQLFSKHAFRRENPLDGYINQSLRAINIAGGLPLALEAIGSLLSRTEKKKWDVILEKLENVPHAEVQRKLKISYDALDVRQKRIFLDIACLFIGYDKDTVVHFWDKSELFPEEAMEVLQNMSLIKIKEDNKVWMHGQFRDLGREMVRLKSKMKIEKQSRVWNPEKGLDLLWRHERKREVKALRLKLDHQRQFSFTYKDFERLPNLMFLEVDGSVEDFRAEERLLWHESPSNVHPANVFRGNSDLLRQLKWLSWRNIPPTFNITKFSMENVVILDLSKSVITHDWNGWSHMKVIKNLKVLNLTDCRCLGRTPNFSAHANLERLILRGCSKLVAIDRSICQLKHLVYLDVRYCRNLRRLPDELGGLEALKELLIDSTPIDEIPSFQGMRNLRTLTASDCGKIKFPASIGNLASLEYLSLKGCKSLETLPVSIGNLESLIELDISKTRIRELPDSIGNLKNLKVVKMAGSPIGRIPNALWTIEKLEEVEAEGNLLFDVKIGNCIHKNKSLRILRLRDAKIYAVPRLPESLIILDLDVLYMMFPDLSNLINLKELDLRFGTRNEDVKSNGLVEDLMPQWIGKLSKLKYLGLESDYVTTLPTDINLLPQLQALVLTCSNLCRLPMLPSSLLSLGLYNCRSLCSVDLSYLKKLSSLRIWSSSISEIQGLDCLENLLHLDLFDAGQVEVLPDLSNLNKLIHLELRNCGNLVEIQGKLPQSLGELRINSCERLQKLPDLSNFEGDVVINGCLKLNVDAILGYARRSWQISGRSWRGSACCS